MDYKKITSAVKIFQNIQEWASYVSKERFDIAAKVKYGIDDEKHLNRLYGLFNSACQRLSLFASKENEKDLEIAINIAEFAYLGDELKYKDVPAISNNKEDDYRRYYYRDQETGQTKQIDINLRDPQHIIMLAELLRNPKIKFISVVAQVGEFNDVYGKPMKYFDGDIIFVYGNITDRLFYDWYKTDAGVYLATRKGWRKLQYVRGRGYLDKEGKPEFENDNCYTDYKVNDYGRKFRYVGNIHQDRGVLMEKTKENQQEK